jgi:hypothetical protein
MTDTTTKPRLSMRDAVDATGLTGLTGHTIRFYEREGLFAEPLRRDPAGPAVTSWPGSSTVAARSLRTSGA